MRGCDARAAMPGSADDMTLLSELIDIPEQVHKGDFVLRLTAGVERADQTPDRHGLLEM